MLTVVFGPPTVSSDETTCGFMPVSVVVWLQASEKRIEAAQSLLNLVSAAAIDTVDFSAFLAFSGPFLQDDIFSVVNCFNEMIEVLLPRVGPGCVDFLEEFLALVITPLSNQRRSVRILVVNLMLLFI